MRFDPNERRFTKHRLEKYTLADAIPNDEHRQESVFVAENEVPDEVNQ
jgi:hypothetical protein